MKQHAYMFALSKNKQMIMQNFRKKETNKKFSKQLLTLVFLMLFNVLIFPQEGKIKGIITDENTKETLIGASILVQGTSKGAITSIDGDYFLTITPGTYTLIVQSMSYEKKTIPNIVVKAGETTLVDISMKEIGFALDNVVVVAKRNLESETILLMEQKASVVAKQAVGAKEMSRKGISDAEDAVVQVSGISKQEGVKNVFVRGLGDRYNYTTLNGFPIPSEDPEYKNISLDFFGSDIIQNIGLNKVFTSDNYSDVGGAVIDISSKELFNDKELNVDISCGSTTNTMNTDLYKMDGVNYWGIATNTHPENNYKTTYNFANSLNPKKITSPLNYSYSLSGGKKIKIGKKSNPLSLFLVASYGSSASYTNEKILNANAGGVISSELEGSKSSENINQLVLGNINYLTKSFQINYNFLMLHDNSQYVGKYVGYGGDYEVSDSYDGFMLRQQTNDNLLLTNQLLTKWELSKNTDLNAGVAYNQVIGTEPDRRINKLNKNSADLYKPLRNEDAHIRNTSKLVEDDFNAKIKLSYHLPDKFKEDISSVRIGYNGRYVLDDFNAVEYCYNSYFFDYQPLSNLLLDSWYNQHNYENKLFAVAGKRESNYTVNKLINSGFLAVDYQFTPSITANLGLNIDIVAMDVNYDIKNGQKKGATTLDSSYILPSFNLKYNLTEKHALRLGLSKTYTLPQSKEISPYQYIGLSFNSQGNPNLVPSDNYNVDLKWDYYVSISELISVTTFYKYIQNPIARTYTGSAAGFFSYENISDIAMVGGIELEARKNIFNLTNSSLQKENKLSIGLNASYIYSTIEVFDPSKNEAIKTQLEGAAPWLLNLDISYNYAKKNTSFINSLVLSYFSDRIYSIGLLGFQDVIEKGIPTLNFVSISNLSKHFSIKFKAKNLIDPEYLYTRKDATGKEQTLNSYYKGVDFSLGLSYKF